MKLEINGFSVDVFAWLPNVFYDESPSKETRKRSILRKRLLKSKSLENRMLYIQERNYRESFLKNTKIRYYADLKEKKILDNKWLWKVVKPLFSDKSISVDKFDLTKNGLVNKSKLK